MKRYTNFALANSENHLHSLSHSAFSPKKSFGLREKNICVKKQNAQGI